MLCLSCLASAQWEVSWLKVDSLCHLGQYRSAIEVLHHIEDTSSATADWPWQISARSRIVYLEDRISDDSVGVHVADWQRWIAACPDTVARAMGNLILAEYLDKVLGNGSMVYRHLQPLFGEDADMAAIVNNYYLEAMRYPKVLSRVPLTDYSLSMESCSPEEWNQNLYDFMAGSQVRTMSFDSAVVRDRFAKTAMFYANDSNALALCEIRRRIYENEPLDILWNRYEQLPASVFLASCMCERYPHVDKTWHDSIATVLNRFPNAYMALTLGQRLKAMEAPYISTNLTEVTDSSLTIHIKTRNVPELRLLIYRNAYHRNEYVTDSSSVREVCLWKNDMDFFGSRDTVLKIKGLKTGVYDLNYLLQCKDSLYCYKNCDVDVTSMVVLSREYERALGVYVCDRKNGRPIRNVRIDHLGEDRFGLVGKHPHKVTLGKTDKNGLFNGLLPIWYDDNSFRVRTSEFTSSPYYLDYAFFSYEWESGIETNHWYKADKSMRINWCCDLPLYRPNDTIRCKGILHKAGRLLKNQPVQVYLYEGNTPIDSVYLTTNDFGSFAAELHLPSTIGKQSFSLKAVSNKVRLNYNKSLEVTAYKTPTCMIVLDSLHSTVSPGDKVHITGKVQSMAQNPLFGVRVNYKLADNSDRLVSDGYSLTDNQGQFSVDLQIPSSQINRMTFTVSIVDAGGYTAMDRLTLNLDDRYTWNAKDVSTIEKGRHPGLGVIRFSYNWNKRNGSPFLDGSWMILQQSDTLAKGAVVNGSFLQSPDFGTWEVGTYQLKFAVKDVQGHSFADSTDMVVFDWNTPLVRTDLDLWVACERDHYVGDSVRFIVGSKHKLYVLCQWQKEYYGFDFQYESVYVDACSRVLIAPKGFNVLKVLAVFDGKSYVAHCRSNSRQRQKNVSRTTLKRYARKYPKPQIELEQSVRNLVPGQDSEFKFRVKDQLGNPLKAEVLALMYDKSLEEYDRPTYSDYLSPKIRPRLYFYNPVARYKRTMQTDFGWENQAWNGFATRDYAPTVSRMSPCMLIGRKGTVGYGVKSFIDSGAGTNVVKSEVTGSVCGASVIIRGVGETGYFEDELDEVVVGYGVANYGGVYGSGGIYGYSNAYEEEPSASAKIPASVGSASNLKVRDGQVVSGFFYPQLVTDDDGYVNVRYKAPQGISAWRRYLIAHIPQMRMTQYRDTVLVTQPFVVHNRIPRNVYAGDSLTLISRLEYTAEPNDTAMVEWRITDKSGTLLDSFRTQVAVDTISSPVVTFDWNVPNTPDSLFVTVVSQTSKYSDGEKMCLPVLDTRVLQTETYPFAVADTGVFELDLSEIVRHDSTGQLTKSVTFDYYPSQKQQIKAILEDLLTAKDGTSSIDEFGRYYASSLYGSLCGGANTYGNKKRINDHYSMLSSYQRNDGAFEWYRDCGAGELVSLHLAHALRWTDDKKLLAKCRKWLMQRLSQKLIDFDERQRQKKVKDSLSIAYNQLYTLYVCPLDTSSAYRRFYSAMKRQWPDFSICEKAMAACVAYANGDTALSATIRKGLDENSVLSSINGRYWPHANDLETQCVLSEMYELLGADESWKTEMIRYLLVNKQNNRWDNSWYTLLGLTALVHSGVAGTTAESNIRLAGHEWTLGPSSFVENEPVSLSDIKEEPRLTLCKKEPVWSYGAVYHTYENEQAKVNAVQSPLLEITKRLFVWREGAWMSVVDSDQLKVGEQVKARLTLDVRTEMELLHLSDLRMSAFEPDYFASGYYWSGFGCYRVMQDDRMDFYINHLNEGVYVLEYTGSVSHAGRFLMGGANLKGEYNPQLQVQTESRTMYVKP
ncbi:MAG: hypothetical protein J5808_05450 [Paludibacteraceae bacterium]|nr:hypothetical protein [Paludibacteraceae bacterium]